MDLFVLLCKAHELPEPVPEFFAVHGRKYRWDYAFPPAWLLIEVHGGFARGGRGGGSKIGGHSSVTGILRDMDKANCAALEGFRTLYFTPRAIKTGDCLPILKTALTRFWEKRPWPNERT